MKSKNYINAVWHGILIVMLDNTYGQNYLIGWIIKSILIFYFIAFIYLNLKDE